MITSPTASMPHPPLHDSVSPSITVPCRHIYNIVFAHAPSNVKNPPALFLSYPNPASTSVTPPPAAPPGSGGDKQRSTERLLQSLVHHSCLSRRSECLWQLVAQLFVTDTYIFFKSYTFLR